MIAATASRPVLATLPRNRSTAVGRRSASAQLGLILLMLLIFLNEAVFRRKDPETFGFDWQVALRLLLCGVCGLYGLAHLRQAVPTLMTRGGLLAAAFAAWTVLTIPFALAPMNAAAACLSLWLVLLFIAAVIHTVEPRDMLWGVIVSLFAFLIGSWTVRFVNPALAMEEQLMSGGETIVRFGGLQHPNGLGREAALAIAMLLVAGLRGYARWRTLALPLVFAAFTAYMTGSRTGMLAAAAAVVVAAWGPIWWMRISRTTYCLAPLAVAAIAVAAFWVWSSMSVEGTFSEMSRTGDSEEIYTMTGRTQVWEFVLENIEKSPWVGCGQGCTRFVMEDNFFPTHHAHNLLLNVILGTGIIGGGLFLLQFGFLARRSFVSAEPFTRLLLVLVLVGGAADSVMLGPTPDSHTVLWLMALLSTSVWPASSGRHSVLSEQYA